MLLQGYTNNTYAAKSLDMEIGKYHPFLYLYQYYSIRLHSTPKPRFLAGKNGGDMRYVLVFLKLCLYIKNCLAMHLLHKLLKFHEILSLQENRTEPKIGKRKEVLPIWMIHGLGFFQ